MDVSIVCNPDSFSIIITGVDPRTETFFVALGLDLGEGCAVIPFGQRREGSTVFAPFRVQRHYAFNRTESWSRPWDRTSWLESVSPAQGAALTIRDQEIEICFDLPALGSPENLAAAVYAKRMEENDGWGFLLPCGQTGAIGGFGDQTIPRFAELVPSQRTVLWRNRLGGERPRIYQLLVRLFGNTNERRKANGTLLENGVGKFADISDSALSGIRQMGFTHIWLTGVLEQMTATDYSEFGAPADDPDLLKGLAGSPYAVKDYFDVSPDYAIDPGKRLEEFKAVVDRIHRHQMKVIIDFVPNHVARSYSSDVKPGLSFGALDDKTHFFHPLNNFFYLRPTDAGGPPLRLPTVRDGVAVSPTCQILGSCDGLFPAETENGRVTGNNVVSWAPSITDWYETVKLNYGYDFTTGERRYQHGDARDVPHPNTWEKMNAILAYWQSFGVDGFRCDMAHMVPPEFWNWAIGQARRRDSQVWFMAEAYDNDPAKVHSGNPLLQSLNDHQGNVMFDLLSAGFNAVYDDPSYKALKSLYDGPGWANDLDRSFPHPFIFHNSLRYSENHDEVRLAANEWGRGRCWKSGFRDPLHAGARTRDALLGTGSRRTGPRRRRICR